MWGVREVGLLSYGGRAKAMEDPAIDTLNTVWRRSQIEECPVWRVRWGSLALPQTDLEMRMCMQGVYWEVTSGSATQEESSETGKGAKSLPFIKWPHWGATTAGNWDSTPSETLVVADHSLGTNSLALLAKYSSHVLPFRGQRIPSVRESQTMTDWSWNLLQATLVEVCRLEGSWQETYRASEGTNRDYHPEVNWLRVQHGVLSWLARATASVCTAAVWWNKTKELDELPTNQWDFRMTQTP